MTLVSYTAKLVSSQSLYIRHPVFIQVYEHAYSDPTL